MSLIYLECNGPVHTLDLIDITQWRFAADGIEEAAGGGFGSHHLVPAAGGGHGSGEGPGAGEIAGGGVNFPRQKG